MIGKSILFLFLVLLSIRAGASSHHSFAYVPQGGRYDNGYPEAKYNEVLKVLKSVYGPIIKEKGGSFHILQDWSDGAVNMWAFRNGSEYWLEIPGGMSRYHLINEEGFLLSACHELGHLLGGGPYKGTGSLISLEGQSDYYASLNCIEKVLNQVRPYKEVAASDEVKSLCGVKNEKNELCERILEGALSLTSYYAELEKVSFPKFSRPSKVVVNKTLKVHPPAQCRLDTFFAGYKKQKRPSCWYKN